MKPHGSILQVLKSTTLEIHCADGSLLAFVSHSMPADMQSTLSDKLKLCFEHNVFVQKDSAHDGEVGFDTIHLAYYNWHVTRVSLTSTWPSLPWVDSSLSCLLRETKHPKTYNLGYLKEPMSQEPTTCSWFPIHQGKWKYTQGSMTMFQ